MRELPVSKVHRDVIAVVNSLPNRFCWRSHVGPTSLPRLVVDMDGYAKESSMSSSYGGYDLRINLVTGFDSICTVCSKHCSPIFLSGSIDDIHYQTMREATPQWDSIVETVNAVEFDEDGVSCQGCELLFSEETRIATTWVKERWESPSWDEGLLVSNLECLSHTNHSVVLDFTWESLENGWLWDHYSS